MEFISQEKKRKGHQVRAPQESGEGTRSDWRKRGRSHIGAQHGQETHKHEKEEGQFCSASCVQTHLSECAWRGGHAGLLPQGKQHEFSYSSPTLKAESTPSISGQNPLQKLDKHWSPTPTLNNSHKGSVFNQILSGICSINKKIYQSHVLQVSGKSFRKVWVDVMQARQFLYHLSNLCSLTENQMTTKEWWQQDNQANMGRITKLLLKG